MPTTSIHQIEQHARQIMDNIHAPDLRLAHDFAHADRVRRHALHIARQEGYADLELVEATALLHDIGLASVTERSQHAAAGAEHAAQWLREQRLFNEAQITVIDEAIRAHGATSGGGVLGDILRDADILDLLGAIGIARAYTSKYDKPIYDSQHVKGETWGMSSADFTQRFEQRVGIGACVADQINFQISCYDNLTTPTARQIGQPLVAFMRAFVVQLAGEAAERTD